MKKRCSRCGKSKDESNFFKNRAKKDGLDEYCKTCRVSYRESRKKESKEYKATVDRCNKAYYRRNRSKILKKVKKRRLVYKYGMTEKQYKKMVKDQGEKCAICKRKARLVVDHNHRTGRVRGLLCVRCNNGLGQFLDRPSLLKKALVYLNS